MRQCAGSKEIIKEVMLIESRGDFSDEDCVILLQSRLRFFAIKRVYGVAGFMGKGENVIKLALEIQKNEGVVVVSAVRISARPFS